MPRALAEVAALEPYDETLGAVAASVQRRATKLDELDQVASTVRTGAARLRTAVADLRGSRAQSALAHRVTRYLESHAFWLDAEVPVRCGRRVAEVDLAVRGTRVAIEVDGHAEHSGRDRLFRDRRRQNRLVTAGWVVLRVDWLRMVRDPGGFLVEVREAVAADGDPG